MFGSREECHGKNICRCRFRYVDTDILQLLTVLFLVVQWIKELQNSQKIINEIARVSLYLFINPININGLNYYRTS